MRIGCSEACACVSWCFESAKQTFVATVESIEMGRRNPEVFQKTCILFASTIQGINFSFRSNYLPDLVRILDFAQSFDFYGFCRLPRYIFHPFVPGRLDEDLILDQLEVILCKNWNMGKPDAKGIKHDPIVRKFAKERLVDLMEEMLRVDFDVRTGEDFKFLLKNQLIKHLESFPKLYPRDEFDPEFIDIHSLQVNLKKISFLEYISDAIFILVDIACVPSFIFEWFDLSNISNRLGNMPLLKHFSQSNLDNWISCFMCTGYIALFLEAFRSLCQDLLSHDERRNAKWVMVASVAETLYNSAILLKKDIKVVVLLAVIAKLLGLIQIWQSPKISFFTEMG